MTSVHFDHMCWLKPDEKMQELEWLLRYGDWMKCGSLTVDDKMGLASLIQCYTSLINSTNERRNRIANKIKSFDTEVTDEI